MSAVTLSCTAIKQEVVYNSSIHAPIFPKLHRIDDSPALNTPMCQYLGLHTVPPSGNRKYVFSHTFPWIYPKFTYCGLYLVYIKTFTCQASH